MWQFLADASWDRIERDYLADLASRPAATLADLQAAKAAARWEALWNSLLFIGAIAAACAVAVGLYWWLAHRKPGRWYFRLSSFRRPR